MAMLKGPPVAGLRRQLRQSAAKLAERPEVTHVTLGEKITGGAGTGLRSLKVHLRHKRDVARADRIPAAVTLKGGGRGAIDIPTDVIEAESSLDLLGARSGGNLQAFDFEHGTVTLAFTKGANAYVLTNAHVAANLAIGKTGPMRFRQAAGPWVPLGTVIQLSPMVAGKPLLADLAVIKAQSPELVDNLLIGPNGVTLTRHDVMRPHVPEHWFYAPGLNVCGMAEPFLTDVTVRADGVDFVFRGVWQLPVKQGLALGGISGALLCRTHQGLAVGCGQVFGGIGAGGQLPNGAVWVFPFKPLYDALWPTLPG